MARKDEKRETSPTGGKPVTTLSVAERNETCAHCGTERTVYRIIPISEDEQLMLDTGVIDAQHMLAMAIINDPERAKEYLAIAGAKVAVEGKDGKSQVLSPLETAKHRSAQSEKNRD